MDLSVPDLMRRVVTGGWPALLDADEVEARAWLADFLRNAAGFHFEAMVVRDLRIYSQPLGGVVESWRDANGREVDAVITVPGGGWDGFEVKLYLADVDAAAASLLRFSLSVGTSRHGKPAALAVVTSSGHAGRRSDGVVVLPITALGP